MTEILTPTELVTVAVNQPQPPATLPPGLDIHHVAALVRDLAMNMYDVDVILKKHGLTAEQHKTLEANEFFQRALQSATMEWNSPQSTAKRLAMEAAIALEVSLPDIAARMRKTDEPLSGVIEAAKLFAKMAGVGEEKTPNAPGEKFTININLGEDTIRVEKNRSPASLVEVQPLPQGEGARPPLLDLDPTRGGEPPV